MADKGKNPPFKKTSSRSVNVAPSSTTSENSAAEQADADAVAIAPSGQSGQSGGSGIPRPTASSASRGQMGRKMPMDTLKVPRATYRAPAKPQRQQPNIIMGPRSSQKPRQSALPQLCSNLCSGFKTAQTAPKAVASTTPIPDEQIPQIIVTAPESTSTPVSPAPVVRKRLPVLTAPPPAPTTQTLEKMIETDLLKKVIASGARASARGARMSQIRRPPPAIMTAKGLVPTANQLVLEQKVQRGVQGEHVSEKMTGLKYGAAQKLEMNVQHFDPSAGLPAAPVPSKEIIVIKRSVSASRSGVTKKVTTIIHEKTGPKEFQPDPKEISRMVDEESRNIEEGLKMLRTKSQAPVTGKTEPLEDVPEDLPPETLAAIMHTEEQGLAMASPPTQIYKILFPDQGESSSIPVSSVVPAPLQDVVVPTNTAAEWCGGFTREELEQTIAKMTEQMAASQRKPTDSMYSEAVQKFTLQSPPSPIPAKVRRKRTKPVGEEKAPWDAEDFQPIADLVGAAPSPAATSGFDVSMTEPQRMFPTDTSGLEYILVPQPPSHISRVQLRGSTKPAWFPGYYYALPDRGRGIHLTSSPSGVLLAAWKEVQPANFGEDSFVVR